MKKTTSRFTSFIIIFLLIIGSASAANVTPDASLYLYSYSAFTYANGNGNIEVYFDASATSTMTQIGASCIVIQEKIGSSWYGVQTYYASTTPGMLGANTGYWANYIAYSGISGHQYRAIVTIYAANASGSDSRTVTTNTVTA